MYYYSQDFLGSSFPANPISWRQITLSFDQQWFIYDETTEQYVETEMTEEVLSDVQNIGVRFFPTEDNETIWSPFLDNFALTPTVLEVLPIPDFSNGNFTMTFDAAPGNRYDFQTFNVATEAWEDLTGQTDIVPAETTHIFETSIAPGKELFRVSSEASYTQVISTAGAPED